MVIKIDNKKINLGDLKQGTIKQFSLEVENTSNKPVPITLNVSCGCTIPTITKNPIPAGETAKLNAKFDTTGKGGFQSKSIYVEFLDNGANQRITIPFTANVVQ